LAFGRDAPVIRPLTLWDRRSYHRSDLAARAHWKLDGHTTELSPDNEHSRSRWCIKLNGSLHREIKVELSPSFEEPGIALMIMVCQLNSASGEDYALTAVPHSILCASFHSARRTFVPKITQGKRLLWARLGLLHQSALKADMICHPPLQRFSTSRFVFCIAFLFTADSIMESLDTGDLHYSGNQGLPFFSVLTYLSFPSRRFDGSTGWNLHLKITCTLII